MESKKKLRESLLIKRQRIPAEEHARNSKIISERLNTWIATQQISQIFSFQSMKQEPSLDLILSHVPIAFPVMMPDRQLAFYTCEDKKDFVLHPYGMKQPSPEKTRLLHADAQTLVLLPALAVDARGFRLGYGGGYYDRFLKEFPEVLSMVVIFSEFILQAWDVDPWDIPVKYICCENGIYKQGGVWA